jgi:putative hydrolases of HD superfamily
MDPLRATLVEALALKELPRAGWLRVGVKDPESVAAHSWGVAWLVLALCPEGVDRGRALTMAVLHDLAEVRVGDLTPHDGVDPAEKSRREAEAMTRLLEPLPGGDQLMAAWREFEDGVSAEARFVRSCDRLDMALQAGRYADLQGVDTAEFIASALSHIDEPELRGLAAGSCDPTS